MGFKLNKTIQDISSHRLNSQATDFPKKRRNSVDILKTGVKKNWRVRFSLLLLFSSHFNAMQFKLWCEWWLKIKEINENERCRERDRTWSKRDLLMQAIWFGMPYLSILSSVFVSFVKEVLKFRYLNVALLYFVALPSRTRVCLRIYSIRPLYGREKKKRKENPRSKLTHGKI